jgi:hypothetical protein
VTSIHPQLLLYLILSFILCTVIGTLTHEGGHIAAAKYYGYETTLHYASMSFQSPPSEKYDTLKAISQRNREAIKSNIDFSEKQRFDSLNHDYFTNFYQKKHKYHRHHIRAVGPLQTLLTSIIGIFILLYRRQSILARGMQLWDWLVVFLALFSLRFVSNLTLSVLSELWKPNGNYFGGGDEARLARSLDLPLGMFAIPLFIIGFLTALWVIFKILPAKHWLTFILSGLIGGVLGFILWMDWLGPIVLP